MRTSPLSYWAVVNFGNQVGARSMQKISPSPRAIRFALFEVDLGARELRKQGVRIKLQEQPFQILHLLLERPGQVVSREELRQRIWPADTFVDFDHGLYSAIKKLREALGDSAENPRFIETLSKRGYRFIAPVDGNGTGGAWPVPEPGLLEKAGTEARPWYRRNLIPLLAIFAVAAILVGVLVGGNTDKFRQWFLGASTPPPMRSLAVLPLQNLSGDTGQGYFTDGMTDALITDLSQIGSLKIISRTSSMQYKETKKSLPQIARELNVDGVIEGTVQRSGDHVRITAQLIQGPTDKNLWAKSYERDTRDIFMLEREVARDIAHEVQARIATQNQAPLTQLRPVNPKALDAYLQGNYHLRKGQMRVQDKELRTAEEYFQQAIDAAPDFALAYAGLAEAHHNLFWRSSEDFTLMKGAAEKAVALDPTSSQARVELAITKSEDWDWSGAEEEFRRAIALNPNNAIAHDQLAGCLDAMGRLEEGWQEHELAQELDPNQDHLSWALYWQREYDRSIELLQKTLESRPQDAIMRWFLALDYEQKGMYKEWVRELGETFTLMGFPESAGRIQHAFAASGYQGALRQEARELEHWAASKQAYVPGVLADVYTSLGDKDRAFYWLGQGVNHHQMAVTDILDWLKVDPQLAPLRSDPRFNDLLRRAGLPP
jgi:TolB-like protein/DNA-binding winged helix-turn-helix (wHTH) protein/cytochrome c-type biogenesis protein CcmH/NrfG